jgi:NAD(P)H-nitrite reductase large subunit
MTALRYVIIGTGVAAIAAVESIRSQDKNCTILLIGDEPEGFYSRPGLAYYLTGEIPERHLYPFSKEDFHRLATGHLSAQVTQIITQAQQITLHNGSVIPYDRLLVATGARAAPLPIPGHDLQGVFKLDNLADARYILKLARASRSAVVVGGGITALEIVEGLVARGVKTTYLMRGERYWSNVLDETESRIIEQRLKKKPGLQIYHRTEISEILGQHGKVVGVRTRDGRQIKCNLVGLAIGILPRKELAVAAGIHTERGILVNECMQTSDPNVFAAGDVAQVFDPATGLSALDSLWNPAREQGIFAGWNMAGKKISYRRSIPMNVTRLTGLTATIIGAVGHGTDRDLSGIARGDSETFRQLPDAIAAQADVEVNRLRVMVGERTMLGAIALGDQALSIPLQHLIAHQVDIASIRQPLLQPNAPIAAILADFWTAYNQSNDRTA